MSSAKDMVYASGGHVWYDREEKKWVAFFYVRALGRFKTKEEAVAAIKREGENFKEVR